jgi:hypothetical protein
MSHFAQVENGVVARVIVAEQDVINSGIFGHGWGQTSYNGRTRKNYAGVGFAYNESRNAFIPPQPFPSWILVEDTCQWVPPVAMPIDDNMYSWDEDTLSWMQITGA